MPRPVSTPEKDFLRFISKIEFAENGCWIYTGKIDPTGYGRFHVGTRAAAKSWLAHKWSFFYFVGYLATGHNAQLDHTCHTNDKSCPGGFDCLHRRCVKPDHLEPASAKENVLRGLGPTAVNARKEFCIHGHEYTEENTVVVPGGRNCRTCRNDYLRRYRQRVRDNGISAGQ